MQSQHQKGKKLIFWLKRKLTEGQQKLCCWARLGQQVVLQLTDGYANSNQVEHLTKTSCQLIRCLIQSRAQKELWGGSNQDICDLHASFDCSIG